MSAGIYGLSGTVDDALLNQSHATVINQATVHTQIIFVRELIQNRRRDGANPGLQTVAVTNQLCDQSANLLCCIVNGCGHQCGR